MEAFGSRTILRSMPVIEVTNLHKSYGPVAAVRGIDLHVDAGEIFSLLGPNGAGKTTTVEILEGYRTPDSGTVTVLGADPANGGPAFRDRIGIVLQHSGIERELTVREALRRLSSLYTRPAEADDLVGLVGLGDKADARIKTLSGGQRRRLDLAAALAGHPELVFLDEPTTGFDPAARRDAWDLIRRLAGGGTTVILTTHYLDEAQRLADRVAVMAAGKVVATGDPASLGGRTAADATITFRLLGAPIPPAEIPAIPGTTTTRGDDVEITTPDPTRTLHVLTGWALDAGHGLAGLEVTRPSLEDVYLDLVGDAGTEDA